MPDDGQPIERPSLGTTITGASSAGSTTNKSKKKKTIRFWYVMPLYTLTPLVLCVGMHRLNSGWLIDSNDHGTPCAYIRCCGTVVQLNAWHGRDERIRKTKQKKSKRREEPKRVTDDKNETSRSL